jgi:hypothetical protein
MQLVGEAGLMALDSLDLPALPIQVMVVVVEIATLLVQQLAVVLVVLAELCLDTQRHLQSQLELA